MFDRVFFADYGGEVSKAVEGIEEKGDDQHRKTADILEKRIVKELKPVFSSHGFETKDPPSNRHPADLIVKKNNKTLYLDIKTKNVGKKFSRPNLISVDVFFNTLDKGIYLGYLFCDYEIQGGFIQINRVYLVPFYSLSLDCVTVGLLGWGQLQVKGELKISETLSPIDWLECIRGKMLAFYPKEVEKIQSKRLPYFKGIEVEGYAYLESGS